MFEPAAFAQVEQHDLRAATRIAVANDDDRAIRDHQLVVPIVAVVVLRVFRPEIGHVNRGELRA